MTSTTRSDFDVEVSDTGQVLPERPTLAWYDAGLMGCLQRHLPSSAGHLIRSSSSLTNRRNGGSELTDVRAVTGRRGEVGRVMIVVVVIVVLLGVIHA